MMQASWMVALEHMELLELYQVHLNEKLKYNLLMFKESYNLLYMSGIAEF